jgi:tetratricopeptide (TPR) repeat protein
MPRLTHLLFTEEDKIMSGDEMWYRLLKNITNKLVFNILLSQNKLDEAFNYFETVGVNYIIPTKDTQYGQEEYFEVSKNGFPYNTDESKWLGPDELHGATLDCYYAEIWVKVLKYLTKINFYESFIINSPDSPFMTEVENRIIKITEDYLCDKDLKKEILNWKIPVIVGKIYEKQKQWDMAIEHYKIANINDNEKQAFILKCKNQRGDAIDRLLIDELKNLTSDEQRQILAFARIIVKTESKIKNFIRNIFSNNRIKLSDVIDSSIGKKELNDRNKSSTLSISSLPVKDDLDWFTFPELIDLMMNDKYWQLFKKTFQYKTSLITFKTEITPIRNNIAHAKPISRLQLDYALDKTNQLLKLI